MTPEEATVLSSAIGGVSVVAVAVVGWVSARQHKRTGRALADNTDKTEQVLHQVKNDHGTNLRDDLDGLAELVAAHTVALSSVDAGQARIASMLGGVRKRVEQVADKQASHDAASLLIVEELHAADKALAAEVRHHHPPKK